MISVKFYKEIFSYLKGSNRKMEKLAYEEPHNLYASSDIIRVIKSRKMRWVGHATYMGEMRKSYKT
jgi:hypothetical protein